MKMRATGIVRRIDDLGRVVIPRDIRRTMGIKEGDPLEIFVDPTNGSVTFKKYLPFDTHDWERAKAIVLAMYPTLKFGLYDDSGEKKVATNATFPKEINVVAQDCAIITPNLDTIGYIIFENKCLKKDSEKIRAVLGEFFSINA